MDRERTFLRSSEWLLTGSLCLLFLSLFAISRFKSAQFSVDLRPSAATVEVVIDGCVDKPGSYKIATGSPLRDVVKKARPKRFANLRGLNLSAPVREPFQLTLDKLETVKISVVGAVVNPQIVELPYGARICDLKKVIELSPQGDSLFFKKKRLLKDQEEITIPARKE